MTETAYRWQCILHIDARMVYACTFPHAKDVVNLIVKEMALINKRLRYIIWLYITIKVSVYMYVCLLQPWRKCWNNAARWTSDDLHCRSPVTASLKRCSLKSFKIKKREEGKKERRKEERHNNRAYKCMGWGRNIVWWKRGNKATTFYVTRDENFHWTVNGNYASHSINLTFPVYRLAMLYVPSHLTAPLIVSHQINPLYNGHCTYTRYSHDA